MLPPLTLFFFFFFNDTATTEIYTLSLHDALPISTSLLSITIARAQNRIERMTSKAIVKAIRLTPCSRSEEHTSELQSRSDLVCRLLLEKKKKKKTNTQKIESKIKCETTL